VPRRDEIVLRADGVGVRFPRATRDAVHDVSLTLQAGERLALLGPSGSGKTTLALALLGAIPALLPATRRGEVRWAGLGERVLASGTGVAAAVLQDADAQLVALTVEDELAFALENRGLAPAEIEARIENALARPPGQGLARRDRTLTLSGGWRQRLALAAALAEEAGTLVIDEPVAHLDGDAAADAVAAVEAACRDGAAALLIEHRIDHIAPLADRVLVLDKDGAPVASGATDATLREIAARNNALGLRLPVEARVADALVRAAVPEGSPQALAVALAVLGFTRPRPAAHGPVLLELDRASARRGRKTVLTEISLIARAGEVIGIAGPNGAGKSTLALLAASGLGATGGSVRRLGEAPIYVPQNPALAFATGSLGAEAARRGLSWSEAAAAIARADLPPEPDRHPLAFSHGERRRLALAMAVAMPGRRLVILDEPSSGLDGIGLAALDADIATLRSRGAAVLVIAHDLDWLAAIADRILVLEAGRLRAEGSSPQILKQAVEGRLPLRPPPGAKLAQRLGWSFAA
jgi:energy-coupling factor transport system ATP-binding protein